MELVLQSSENVYVRTYKPNYCDELFEISDMRIVFNCYGIRYLFDNGKFIKSGFQVNEFGEMLLQEHRMTDSDIKEFLDEIKIQMAPFESDSPEYNTYSSAISFFEYYA